MLLANHLPNFENNLVLKSGPIPPTVNILCLSALRKEMSCLKYMMNAVSKMCASEWIYLDRVKIIITSAFIYSILNYSLNKGIKGIKISKSRITQK